VAEEARRNSTIPAGTATDEQVGDRSHASENGPHGGTVAISLAYGAAVAASGAARGYPEGPAWALAHVITIVGAARESPPMPPLAPAFQGSSYPSRRRTLPRLRSGSPDQRPCAADG
jgi:hypothetical protein